MHILEMQVLEFLEHYPLQRHSDLFTAFQPLYKSSRTYYKAYTHLLKQKFIQKTLLGGEKYYRYEITPLGRAFLHPDDPNLAIIPLIKEINKKISENEEDPSAISTQITTLRTELQLLYSAITDLPKSIQNSLQSWVNIDSGKQDLNLDSNFDHTPTLEIDPTTEDSDDYYVPDENLIDQEPITSPSDLPENEIIPILDKNETESLPSTSINNATILEDNPSSLPNVSNSSRLSQEINSKMIGLLEGLMGAINGLNSNIQFISNLSLNPANPYMQVSPVGPSPVDISQSSHTGENTLDNSVMNNNLESIPQTTKNLKNSKKKTPKISPIMNEEIPPNPDLPVLGLPTDIKNIENLKKIEPEAPVLPPILLDLVPLTVSELLHTLAQSFHYRDLLNPSDPYQDQIARIELEFIQRSQRGENLTIAQKNEVIGHYFAKDPPLASDIDHLWAFLCRVPLQYQDLVILLPIVDFFLQESNLDQVIDKFQQLPFFALESLLSKPNIKKRAELYLAILELYLHHPLFRDKKAVGSESAVKLWVQWHQHYLDLALQNYDFDEVLSKCDELLPDDDLDDIFYYLSVEHLRDSIMMVLSETRMLRTMQKSPIPANRDEILKETFQVFQDAGGYHNFHLIDWYEKMHEEDLLEFEDFMKELQILLNLRAFSLIQSRIDKYGLFLEKGIKRMFTPPKDYHVILLSPELNDKDERTILLRDILINCLYLQEKYEEIIDKYRTSTDQHIFPWLIRAAIKLGVLPKKQWSLPVARPWWMLVTAQIELSIQDRNTELAQIEALLRQQLNYGLTKHNPYEFFKTYFKEKSDMIRFAAPFARWLREFGDAEHSLELVKLWELHIKPNLKFLDIHMEMLQLKRDLLPASGNEIDQQLHELEEMQKQAYEHNVKELASSAGMIKRKKKSKKS